MKHIFNRISTLILETVTEIDNFTDDKTYLKFTECVARVTVDCFVTHF